MTESGDTRSGRPNDEDSRPLFDPARDRAIERERAREKRERSEVESNRHDRTDSASTTDGNAGWTSSATSRRSATGGTSRTAFDAGTQRSPSRFASASDVTGRGVGLTLFAALLCALGYYGALGLRAEGVQAFGSVVPAPFYALTFAVLFVFSLVPRAHRGIAALGWSVVFSVVFGTLLSVGTEGIFYLADNPGVAIAGYTGLTVLALAIVVASVAYWGVLSVAKTA